ncbi:MAG: hypothetical protein HOV81_36095 [Kofleriaceae bacterium]|nr:hypothetical protein [Kofleriaceae bacterium]
MTAKRVVLGVVAAFVVWLVALAVLAFAMAGRQERQTRERLAESLQATVTIGDSDLALVRGRMSIDRLAIRRDDVVGHLAIDVGSVRCELLPLGLALFDRGCTELVIREPRLEISTAALFRVKAPKRTPIHADRIVIDDAQLVFLPSAFAPNLGRIEISIDHAVAGPTVMRTPLSWLFALEELRARFALPAGITVQLDYRAGMLTVTGSLLGSSPVTLPVQLPVAASARDAQEEMKLLVDSAKDIAERVVAKRAEDWLRKKLIP